MKFKVAKTPDLEPALAVVKGSLGSGDDLDSHLLFRLNQKPDGTSCMEVLTHSGRIFSSCPFKAEIIQTPGDSVTKFTIQEKRLRKALNAFPDDAVITFETTDGKVVDVSIPGANPSYQSLDPDDFRFWDKILEKAELKATVSAKRLAAGLNYSRMFVSDNESRHPELCVCEVKDKVLASTDNRAVAFVKVRGMEGSSLRVHYKDAGGIVGFLNASNGPVEVLEYDRGVFFRREDGAVFGEGRFQAGFPSFEMQNEEDQCWWNLPVKELITGMQILQSSAKDGDQTLTFSREDALGPVCLSMPATTGKTTKREIFPKESGTQDGQTTFTGEFDVNFVSLEKILKAAGDSETLRFGVNRRKKNGYLRFATTPFKTDTDPGDEYLVLVRWTRAA